MLGPGAIAIFVWFLLTLRGSLPAKHDEADRPE
jgi:hypothetical protein